MIENKHKQKRRDDRFKGDETGIETRANSAKGDGRKMNEFRDKMAEEMGQDYIHIV